MKYNVLTFMKQFPDDEACLQHLFVTRFGQPDKLACPKCNEIGKFRKLSNMPAWTCNCGHHIHPMVGTPFQRSTTPLQKWFYAMYLFTTSRHGVPAKELQRQLSVTYKTAWRMGHEIRKYMSKLDGNAPLSGVIEADESYFGGVKKGAGPNRKKGKTIVFGILERGGRLQTHIAASVRKGELQTLIAQNVEEGSTLHTDELYSYKGLKEKGYGHETVRHSAYEFVRGDVYTNSIEGVWSQIKRSIRGTHVHVSMKHMWKYLGEFEYRYNMRKAPELMFNRLLASF
jgi:transposase